MVMEGGEKQAWRLWDKFGMKEVVKEKCDSLYVGVGHHHKATACVCHAQEGTHLSSSGGIRRACARAPRARARRKTFSIVSITAREYGVRLKRNISVFVTFGVFEACNAYYGASKSGIF